MIIEGFLSHSLDYAGGGLPVFIALVLSFHFLEINEKAFFFSSRTEMKLHACVIAVLKACLGLRHAIIEIAIEVWQAFVIELAGVHTVGENNATSCFLVKIFLIDFFGLETDSIDTHLVLSRGARRIQVIRTT